MLDAMSVKDPLLPYRDVEERRSKNPQPQPNFMRMSTPFAVVVPPVPAFLGMLIYRIAPEKIAGGARNVSVVLPSTG